MSYHTSNPFNRPTGISMIPATKRKRTANACSRCRLRKQRCDGFSLPCKNCARAGTECTFPDDATGERLLREHISVLESKFNELANALRAVDPNHPILSSNGSTPLPRGALSAKNQSLPGLSSQSDSTFYRVNLTENSGQKPEKEPETPTEDALVNGIGFLSLTSGAEPLYVGGSSGASWGRLFSLGLRRPKSNVKSQKKGQVPPQASSEISPSKSCNDSAPLSSHYSSFSETSPMNTVASYTTGVPYPFKPRFVFPSLAALEPFSDQIFETVYSTVQARHCFMNFPKLKEWYDQREVYCGQSEEVMDNGSRTAAFFLWLSYALGLRLWEGQERSLEGLPSNEHCFEAALHYFDHVESNTTTIQALLFLAMFSFRSDKGLSAWHLAGLAMRTALELGLHRRTPKAKRTDAFGEEMRKRVWWSVYCLDRTMALQLGRPIAIQDEEIDTELPLNIDCHITDSAAIIERRKAIEKAHAETNTNFETNPYPLGYTSMSSSLHIIRLRTILAKVKEKIYDDKPEKNSEKIPLADSRRSDLDRLLLELDRWRSQMPIAKGDNGTKTTGEPAPKAEVIYENTCSEGKNYPTASRVSAWKPEGMPFYAVEWFDLQYYNAIQTLLIPYSLTAHPGDPYLKRAVQSATRSCELQRNRVKHGSLAPLSLYALHKLFMSGAFVIYALDRHPEIFEDGIIIEQSPSDAASGDSLKHTKKRFRKALSQESLYKPDPIQACREVLAVYVAHYPSIQSYYKCFEQIFETSRDRSGKVSRGRPHATSTETKAEKPRSTTNSGAANARKSNKVLSHHAKSNSCSIPSNSSTGFLSNNPPPTESFPSCDKIPLDGNTCFGGNQVDIFPTHSEFQPMNGNLAFKNFDPQGYGDLTNLLRSEQTFYEFHNNQSARISPVRIGMIDTSKFSGFPKSSGRQFEAHENLVGNGYTECMDDCFPQKGPRAPGIFCQVQSNEPLNVESTGSQQEQMASTSLMGDYTTNVAGFNTNFLPNPNPMKSAWSFENYLLGGRTASLSSSFSSSQSLSHGQLEPCAPAPSFEFLEGFPKSEEFGGSSTHIDNPSHNTHIDNQPQNTNIDIHHSQIKGNQEPKEVSPKDFCFADLEKDELKTYWVMPKPENQCPEFVSSGALDSTAPQLAWGEPSIEFNNNNYQQDQGLVAMMMNNSEKQLGAQAIDQEGKIVEANSQNTGNIFGRWCHLDHSEIRNNNQNNNNNNNQINNDPIIFSNANNQSNINQNMNETQKRQSVNLNIGPSSPSSSSSLSPCSSLAEDFGKNKMSDSINSNHKVNGTNGIVFNDFFNCYTELKNN